MSARLGVQDWELRMHNPFLAKRHLRPGDLIAYPKVPRTDLFRAVGGAAEYRMRHGDNYIKLALTLGVQPDALRSANGCDTAKEGAGSDNGDSVTPRSC